MLKSLGADLSSNGRHAPTKILFFHSIAKRYWSVGWTGKSLKALLILILASKVLGPVSSRPIMVSSIVM